MLILRVILFTLLSCLPACLAADCSQPRPSDGSGPNANDLAALAINTLADTCSKFAGNGNQTSTNQGYTYFAFVTSPGTSPDENLCDQGFQNIIDQCISNDNFYGGQYFFNNQLFNLTNSVPPDQNGGSPIAGGGGEGVIPIVPVPPPILPPPGGVPPVPPPIVPVPLPGGAGGGDPMTTSSTTSSSAIMFISYLGIDYLSYNRDNVRGTPTASVTINCQQNIPTDGPNPSDIANAIKPSIDQYCGAKFDGSGDSTHEAFNHGFINILVQRQDTNTQLDHCPDAINGIINTCIIGSFDYGGVANIGGESYNISNSDFPNNPLIPGADQGAPAPAPTTDTPIPQAPSMPTITNCPSACVGGIQWCCAMPPDQQNGCFSNLSGAGVAPTNGQPPQSDCSASDDDLTTECLGICGFAPGDTIDTPDVKGTHQQDVFNNIQQAFGFPGTENTN